MSKTICVFLHYQDAKSWTIDTKEGIFKEGKIIWAGYKPIQLEHDDGVEWDEIVVVEYSNEELYNDVLKYLAHESNINPYQVLLLEPTSPKELEMRNTMLRKARDDPNLSVDFTPASDIDKVYPSSDRYKWEKLFNGDYQNDIVMINLSKFYDVPKYPDEYKGTRKKTIEAAFAAYTTKAFPTLGKIGAQIDTAGGVLATLVSVRDINYEGYGFVHYPSVPAFRKIFTSKTRLEGVVHQLAAKNMELGDGYAIRPYKEFCS